METNTWYYLHSTVAQTLAAILGLSFTVVLFRLQQLENQIQQASEIYSLKLTIDKAGQIMGPTKNLLTNFNKLFSERKWEDLLNLVLLDNGWPTSIGGDKNVLRDIIRSIDIAAGCSTSQKRIISISKITASFGLITITVSILCLALTSFFKNSHYSIAYTITVLLTGISLFLLTITLMRIFTDGTSTNDKRKRSELYLTSIQDPILRKKVAQRLEDI